MSLELGLTILGLWLLVSLVAKVYLHFFRRDCAREAHGWAVRQKAHKLKALDRGWMVSAKYDAVLEQRYNRWEQKWLASDENKHYYDQPDKYDEYVVDQEWRKG